MSRADRLIARMRRERGYLYPEWELIARESPGFTEAYDQLYRLALGRDAGLPVKYRELVATGILAFRGEVEGLVNHVRRALEHGATRAEVLGAIEAMLVPGGGVAFLNALRAFARVEAARARRPRTRTRTRTADRTPARTPTRTRERP